MDQKDVEQLFIPPVLTIRVPFAALKLMRIPSAYFAVLGSSLLLALVPTVWPGLDIAVAAFFLQANAQIHPSQWSWVDWINEYTPDVFRITAIFFLSGWLAASLVPRWRRHAMALAFVGFSITLGPGLATWALKEHTLRARPLDVVTFGGVRQFTPALKQADQCADNCAFSSGHAACGFYLISLMLLNPGRRWHWVVVGILTGLAVCFARVSVGAHWLSDVLWACPITLSVSGVVWLALMRLYRPRHRCTGV
jgi:lipid A 4'-phosphatase